MKAHPQDSSPLYLRVLHRLHHLRKSCFPCDYLQMRLVVRACALGPASVTSSARVVELAKRPVRRCPKISQSRPVLKRRNLTYWTGHVTVPLTWMRAQMQTGTPSLTLTQMQTQNVMPTGMRRWTLPWRVVG